MDGLTERKRFDAWAAKHMTMDGYPAYTAWDAWQAAILAAPSLPAGDGLTNEVRALLEKFIEFSDANYVPNTLFDRARAILAAPRQPGEVGAGVQERMCSGRDWWEHALPNSELARPSAAAPRHAPRVSAASAQQDEREALPANRVMDAQVLEIACMHGGVIKDAWTFVGNAGLLRFVRAILAAEKARAAQQVQADAGAVYQVWYVDNGGSWCDVQKAKWDAHHPQSRRIMYRAPQPVSPAAESDKRDAIKIAEAVLDHCYGKSHVSARMIEQTAEVVRAAMSREQSGGGE